MLGLYAVLLILWIGADAKAGAKLCFKGDFAFGIATAAYQIEGGWNAKGKGESIWDRYTHEHPELVFDHSNADVADDSYHRFREDVGMLRELGVSFYRLSISWPRIMPSGISNEINENGVRYYKNVLSELKKHNIHALVTMYHWDLPQSLQDLGGWTNPIIVDYFADYATFLFKTFGHQVKAWITFNEPLTFCGEGYGGQLAPGGQSGFEDYLCAHNVLKAHGRAYRIYKEKFNASYQGYVGISLNMEWIEPVTTSAADKAAAETARQFMFGWYAHPIFSKQGDYPPIMRSRIDYISRRQGYPRSRLPSFTEAEVLSIQGSADFLGLNHYTTNMAQPGDGKIAPRPNYYDDMGVKLSVNPDWPTSNSSWLRVVPWGFRKTLKWIKDTYDSPSIVVTENGVSLEKGLRDPRRVAYLDGYLRALHAAVYKDSCDVIAYTYWSLMDNFEWMSGYSERFGLYEVEYSSPNRTRTPRLSAEYFSSIAKTGCIPDRKDWEC